MNKIFEGSFYNPSCGMISIEGVMQELARYMAQKPDKFYEVIVGCDSSSVVEPHFPVAIAVLRVGEGGRFFLKKVIYSADDSKKFVHWRARILQEVLLSCDLALSLRELLAATIDPRQFRYQFKYIHADIGENGKTKDMVKELTGLIRGNGFEPKIKPESSVASVLADRYS